MSISIILTKPDRDLLFLLLSSFLHIVFLYVASVGTAPKYQKEIVVIKDSIVTITWPLKSIQLLKVDSVRQDKHEGDSYHFSPLKSHPTKKKTPPPHPLPKPCNLFFSETVWEMIGQNFTKKTFTEYLIITWWAAEPWCLSSCLS